MKRVLVVQTTLQPPGGGNTVAAWMVEALKRDHQVSVLTWKPADLEEINRFYGTNLKDSELTRHWVNPLVRGLINLDPDPRSIQKLCYLMRVCKSWRKNYDVIISADNEIDFGCKGIQYVHYPYFTGNEKVWRSVNEVSRQGKISAFLKGFYRPWMMLSGFSFERMKNNLTLVNSNWTGAIVNKYYDIEPTIVYPPVPGVFPDIPWEKKENGFVCVGRFDPCKRFEQIIEILAAVKESVPSVHLHIIGSAASQNPKEWSDYRQQLKKLAEANASWVSLHQNISRAELAELLARHRYGIHAHENEHFGIAVAEMVRAGCIVFVPNDGGQMEIVGDERLIYQDERDAVEKIVRVLKCEAEQADLHAGLRLKRESFSAEKFMDEIREIIRRF